MYNIFSALFVLELYSEEERKHVRQPEGTLDVFDDFYTL